MILTKAMLLFFLASAPAVTDAVEISPASVDLGDTAHDQGKIELAITLTNDESQTVILRKQRSSCDCLVLEKTPPGELRPGDCVVINAVFLPETLSRGRFKKFLFFYFENSLRPVAAVEVTGNVR